MDYESRLETKDVFYSSLAKYSMVTKHIITSKNEQPSYGKGGVPMGWREDDNTVFIDTSDSHSLIRVCL